MSYVFGIPLLAFLAVLQSTVMNELHLLDGRADLVLLGVVAWGMTGRSEEAMVLGMIGGLFLDLLSGLPLGTHAILLVIIAFLVSLMQARIWEAQFIMPLGGMLIASLLYHTLELLVLAALGRSIIFTFAFNRVILPSTFLNLALALPTFNLAESVRNRLFPPEVAI